MSRKLTPIVRLNGAPRIEAWIRRGTEDRKATVPRADIFTARLTIDVTPELRGRIKVAAFEQGTTVAELLRILLEKTFPVPGGDAR